MGNCRCENNINKKMLPFAWYVLDERFRPKLGPNVFLKDSFKGCVTSYYLKDIL